MVGGRDVGVDEAGDVDEMVGGTDTGGDTDTGGGTDTGGTGAGSDFVRWN